MPTQPTAAIRSDPGEPTRRAWTRPRLVPLARLVRLTLQTGDSIPGGGGTGSGGSTVVP